jgi:hypothetical protein
MRVLAVLEPKFAIVEEKVPCQRKNPTSRAGSVQSIIVLQEIFIGVDL